MGSGAIWLRSPGLALPRLFNLPAGSMIPTLHSGDVVLAAMHTWQIPQPRRGDLTLFKLPKDKSVIYIKRLVGLPGDRIQIVGGVLHINDQPVQRERAEDFKTTDLYGRTISALQYKETLPDGATYFVIERDGDHGYWDNTSVYNVQPGHYFMMGDNRDNSIDSRDSNAGMVPQGNIIGYAALILWSKDASRVFSVPR
jgi:signal peptidase I